MHSVWYGRKRKCVMSVINKDKYICFEVRLCVVVC